MDIESVEALLESGKAAAAAARAEERSGDDGKSDRRSTREPSPSGSSRSHRRSRRDRSRTPRGDHGDRSRSRERDSKRRHRGDDDDDRRSSYSSSSRRHRDKSSDRANGGDEDRERKRRRSRSRSTSRDRHRSSRRHGDDRRDRDRRSDRHGSYDSRRRDDDRRGSHRRRDSRERARDSPRRDGRSRSPNGRMTEEEHEMRSVFVSQLSARVGDRELFQFFENQVGKVRDARVIVDRVSRRSKGVAYVEFFELEDVKKAIGLTGTKLLGIPLLVQYTEAERNRQASLPQPPPPPNVPDHISVPPGSDASGDSPVPWNRLYVGSLNFSLREPDIRAIFEPFGPIDVVDLHFDNITQKSKGYCFVQYRKMANAQEALDRMNGFEIAGRPIRVGLVTEKGSSNPNRSHDQQHLAPGQMANVPQNYQSGGGMRQSTGMQRPDSLEEGGASLNNISRIELMQKLARVEPPGGTLAAPSKPLYRVNVPTATSKSVLLKNMFNPAEETDPGWDTDLRDDVKSECEAKYGPVVEIYVEKESAGEIYVKFDTIESSTRAVTGLNGRWFGGSQVSAHFIPDAVLEAHRK